MQKCGQLLAVAAAMIVCLGAGVAQAQSVVVRKAPAGGQVEVALNAATLGSATVDANGDATVPFPLPETAAKTGIDAYVFVDYCDTMRRVVIVERGRAPLPPTPGCDRREVAGLYWVRKVSTIVVDAGGSIPTLLLIKGSYGLDAPLTKEWMPSMTGLHAFGGAVFGSYGDAHDIACGDVTPCGGHDAGMGYTVGATYWFLPFVGAEGSYVQPVTATANGIGPGFSFNSLLEPRLLRAVGKAGGPIGPVRLYGLGGMSYTWATSRTNQTIDDATQRIEYKTQGWGLVFGGGGEVWVASRLAIYGEVNFTSLKGTPTGGGEARLDDRLRLLTLGLRVRLGK